MANYLQMRSSKIYWNPSDDKMKSIFEEGVDVDEMETEALEYLISELDRRLIQLWDKVQWERQLKDSE